MNEEKDKEETPEKKRFIKLLERLLGTVPEDKRKKETSTSTGVRG